MAERAGARTPDGAATRVGVLVVDDSALMRRIITRLLESDPQIMVVDTAVDGLEAVEKVAALRPDVVTLDIEMPRLDGLGALRRIMAATPTPVVMLSALGEAETVMSALQSGAVDFVHKPSGTVSIDLYKVGAELVHKVKLATFSRVAASRPDHVRPLAPATGPSLNGAWCLALGASTGGPAAISRVLKALPGDFPGSVLIVQHMPVGFTKSFADRLHRESGLDVVEAEHGTVSAPGCAYVAPGGFHMTLARQGADLVLALDETPPVNSVRPSIDVLMASVAEVCGREAVGILLTGMGRDGAAGLAAIRRAGGHTIVQDRETSTIFGMPRAAIGLGVVEQVLPLHRIAPAVLDLLQEKLDADD